MEVESYNIYKNPPLVPLLSQIKIHSKLLLSSSLRSILNVSSHQRPGLPSGLFPPRFLNRPLYALTFSACLQHTPPSYPRFSHANNIG
jgi:hypothetical protein